MVNFMLVSWVRFTLIYIYTDYLILCCLANSSICWLFNFLNPLSLPVVLIETLYLSFYIYHSFSKHTSFINFCLWDHKVKLRNRPIVYKCWYSTLSFDFWYLAILSFFFFLNFIFIKKKKNVLHLWFINIYIKFSFLFLVLWSWDNVGLGASLSPSDITKSAIMFVDASCWE